MQGSAAENAVDRDKVNRLIVAAGAASVTVALVLTFLKFWAWRVTESVALLSSMADSVLDLAASLITFFAVRVAITPPDREHRFGHGKSEAVAGLMQAMIVTGSAVFVGVQAVTRLLDPREVNAPEVGLTVTALSLVLTGLLVAFQKFVVLRTRSVAIGADAVHYQADVLTGVAVLAAIFLNSRFDWYAADPLLALVIVVFIMWSVRAIVLQALDILLDRELPAYVHRSIETIAARHPDVLGVHDVRTRSAGNVQFIQLHLELDAALTLSQVHEISHAVERQVLEEFPSAQVLIHVDPYGLDEPRDPF
jgi:ferrous-iron efflux pump FieF